MKKTTKIAALLLAAFMLAGLTSCAWGGNPKQNGTPTDLEDGEKNASLYEYGDVDHVTYRTLDGGVSSLCPINVYFVENVQPVSEAMRSYSVVNDYLDKAAPGVYVLVCGKAQYDIGDALVFGPAGETNWFCGVITKRFNSFALAVENRGATFRVDGYRIISGEDHCAYLSKAEMAEDLRYVGIEVPVQDINVFY